MFGYNLKPWELFGYPLLAVFIALGITGTIHEGEWRDLAKFGYYAICINSAFVGSFYLYHEAAKYVDARTPDTKEERPIQAANALPPIKVDGMEVYSQGVEVVSVNAVKAFNQHLVTQHLGKLPIKLTENYWTKKEAGMEQSRWVRIGGVGPTDWKDMMSRGLEWGAYKTEGGQDKRVIGSMRKVIQLSQGHPLPTWEQLKKH